MPLSVYALLLHDLAAFNYFYTQVCCQLAQHFVWTFNVRLQFIIIVLSSLCA